jgi:hypothetical protein
MKRWLHGVELLVDEMIPLLLIILIFFTIAETMLPDSQWIGISADIYDGIVVLFFISDLTFKYRRTRNALKFVRKYWIELIASFPLFLVVRFVEVFGYAKEIRESQVIAQQIRTLRGASRSSRLIKFFDLTGFKKVKKFWSKPTGKHRKNKKSRKSRK